MTRGIIMHISTFNPILQMRKCLSPLDVIVLIMVELRFNPRSDYFIK